MDIIFETIDKTGRKIRLTKKRWEHIRIEHSDVDDYNYLKETIIHPVKVMYLERKKATFYGYFKHKKDSAKYLRVIVKYLNGEGFVITSYFVRSIK